jgi:predicted transcriptional regulator
MAVISIRLNQDEEEMVNFLSDHYQQDRSSLIKHSLMELYEDIIDKKTINEYEKKEKNGKINFIDSIDVVNMVKSQKPARNKRLTLRHHSEKL